MSQEVLEALRAEYAAMSRRDWNAVLRVAVPDFELKTPADGLDDGEIFPRREEALEAACLSK
jgi:hypothetical protein